MTLTTPQGQAEGLPSEQRGPDKQGKPSAGGSPTRRQAPPPPVWVAPQPRSIKATRSTPGDNATPTGCPGVVRRVDRPSLDPLAVRLTGLEPPQVAVGPLRLWRLGFKPSAAARGPARVLGGGVGADSLVTASSWIIRDVDGTKVADIRMKGVDQ
jgi:hypothetical protein